MSAEAARQGGETEETATVRHRQQRLCQDDRNGGKKLENSVMGRFMLEFQIFESSPGGVPELDPEPS